MKITIELHNDYGSLLAHRENDSFGEARDEIDTMEQQFENLHKELGEVK